MVVSKFGLSRILILLSFFFVSVFFAFGNSCALANTYGDSTYGSNRYSGNNSTTTAPTAPLSVTAIAGNAQATITFSPPSSNGGASITSYTAVSSPGDITASGASSPIVVTGLENGTSYTFVMTATNSVGISASSTPSNAVIPAEPVTPPTNSGGSSSGSKKRTPRPTTDTPASSPTPVQPTETPSTTPGLDPSQSNTGLPETPSTSTNGSTTANPSLFTRDLQTGARGSDVKELQRFLNSKGFAVATTGPGSAGSETDVFGPATRAALARFQAENGIEPAAGYFGPVTRKLVNSLTSTPDTTTTVEQVFDDTSSIPPVQVEVPATPVSSDTVATSTAQSSFTRDLQTGDTGLDVRELQIFLNSKNFIVAESGPGSTGNETELFGGGTREALKKFQEQNGILPASGYFGQKTRAFLQTLGY